MRRRTAVWLAAVPLAVLALIGHWKLWYQPRLHPAPFGDDLPGRVFASRDFESAVWIAHPHQNLPALADMTGMGGEALVAALRLAGVEAPTPGGVRIPPASSLAVATSEDESGARQWLAAARFHPLAAAFVRLSGLVAGNPWLGGGTVGWPGGEAGTVRVTIVWRGATWLATTGSIGDVDALAVVASDHLTVPAVGRLRHRAPASPGSRVLPAGGVVLFAAEGLVQIATTTPSLAPAGVGAEMPRMLQGRRVLDAAGALLVLARRGGAGGPGPDQSMLLLPLPAGTDESELPRTAILHRPAAEGGPQQTWRMPGEQLLDIAGRDLPRGAAAGWQARATDAVALGSALAAAPALRDLDPLPSWGLWLDVAPAAAEVRRLARGQEQSPFLGRADRQRWHDAAAVLRAMAEKPARLEGFVDGEDLLLRWTARAVGDS